MLDQAPFFKLSYGLYVVSASFEGKSSGCIVNTLSQVTAIPEKLSVTVHKDNFTTGLIERSGVFSAVVLTKDADLPYIGRFGFRSGREADKFDGIAFGRDQNGVPYPTAHAAARFSVRVDGVLDLGTHLLFAGQATEAEKLGDGEVMTYAYYHEVKKGGTPKNAPSFRPKEPAPEKAEKHGFRCTVCGFVLEADELPPDYVCPVCKQGADKFVRF